MGKINKNKTTLFNLKIGQAGIVREILAPYFIKERLHHLGIVSGIKITPIGVAPLGSPRVYLYLHTQIAIRNNLAKKISIKYVKKN